MLAVLLSGCALGPEFAQPGAPQTSAYTPETLRDPGQGSGTKAGIGRGQRFVLGGDVPGRWWQTFKSPQLAALVEASLAANPTVEAALASVRAARETAVAERGALFPQIGFGLSASRQRVAGGDLTSPLSSNQYTYNLVTPGLTAAYTPDLFGGISRRIESSDALAEVQRFQLEAASLTLTANVVSAAIQEASLRGQIEAVKRVIALQQDHLRLTRKQLDLGQATGADAVQQEAALAQFQQTLPPLDKQLAQQRNLLTALAGRFPANEVSERFTLSSLRLPSRLPVSLPGELVRQRPDVRAAEAALHAASAEIGVAIANRFPQVTLGGSLGLSATALAALSAPGAQFYSLAGTVVQPIFDAGTLYHRQRAAEETFAQVEAQYRATVIAAFQNVADALRALQADARAVAAARASVAAAARSVELTRKQLEEGAVDNAALILAQQTYLQALVSDVQAQATRLADTVALFQALGGGWWNRPDAAPPHASSSL